MGGLIQDPGENNQFGPLSGGIFGGVSGTPVEGLGTELACLVNVIDLPPGPPGL